MKSIGNLTFIAGILVTTMEMAGQENHFSKEEYLTLHAQTEVSRAETDLDFKNEEKSPLVKDSIPNFMGLEYFEWNYLYIIPAEFKRISDGREFEMKTTTERLPLYRDFALVIFTFGDSTYTLHAYQNVAYAKGAEYDSSLFIPFTDHTNGEESYGGGRYIDIKIPKGKKVILDFNRAYNPYCAYNKRYSCPIPPMENALPFRVEAGVLSYHRDPDPSMKPSE